MLKLSMKFPFCSFSKSIVFLATAKVGSTKVWLLCLIPELPNSSLGVLEEDLSLPPLEVEAEDVSTSS